jgi:hypothetical protein
MAGGFVIGGSIFLVLSVFDTFTNLNSVEMRDQITEVLSTPSGEGLGLTIDQAKAVMRVGLMIAAACAAAAAVLGVYALQRSRPARLALSILAVPILITAPLTGGFVGALVAAATLMLWSGPARDWYAGRPTRQVEPPQRGSHPGPWEETMPSPDERNRGHEQDPVAPPSDSTSPTVPPGSPASSLSTAGSSSAPASTSGFGQAPAPAPAAQPPGGAPPAYDAMTTRTPVPVTVKVSCIVTWVFAGLVALLYLAMLFVLIVSRDRMVDLIVDTPEWERANLDRDMLVPVLWVGCLMFLGWAVIACLLAWFTWRRQNWARWLLVVSAAVTLVAAMFAFPVAIPHQLAAVVTMAGLFSVQAREWFAPKQSWTSGPPSGPPGSYPPGPYPPASYPSGAYPAGSSAPGQSGQSGQSGPDADPGAGPDQDQGQDQGAGAPPQSPPPGGKPPVW